MLIDLLIADNLYGTVACFTRSFAKALHDWGVRTRVHEIGAFFCPDLVDLLAQDPPDWTFSFSNIYWREGLSLGNGLEIPHHSYLLDPVFYALHHLQGKYSSLSCIDSGEYDFLQQFGYKNVTTLYHGIDAEYIAPPQERRFDAVFFGSCYELPQLNDQELAIAEKVLHTEMSIAEALLALQIKEEDFVPTFHLIDHYTRIFERIQLLKAFPKVIIWGEGPWEKYLPHAKVFPPVSFPEVLSIMRASHYVLSSSPRFKKGYHERVFAAIASGAVAVTAENPLFKGFEGVITYPPGGWREIPDLLQTPTSTAAGQMRLLQEHTWHQRAGCLLKHLQSGHWETSRSERAR